MIDKLIGGGLAAIPGVGPFLAMGWTFARPWLGEAVTALRNPIVLVMVALAFFIGKWMGDREGFDRAAALCEVESAKAIQGVKDQVSLRDHNVRIAAERDEGESAAEINQLRKRLADARHNEQQARAAAAAAQQSKPEVNDETAPMVNCDNPNWAPGRLERLLNRPGHQGGGGG